MDTQKSVVIHPNMTFIVTPLDIGDYQRDKFKDQNLNEDFLSNIDNVFNELINYYGLPDVVISSPYLAQRNFMDKFATYCENNNLKTPPFFLDAMLRHRFEPNLSPIFSEIEEGINNDTKMFINLLSEDPFYQASKYSYMKPKLGIESYTNAVDRIHTFCNNILQVKNYKEMNDMGLPLYPYSNLWILTHSFVTFIASKYLVERQDKDAYINCSQDCIGFNINYNLKDGNICQEILYKKSQRNFYHKSKPYDERKKDYRHNKNYNNNNNKNKSYKNNRNNSNDEEYEPQKKSYNRNYKSKKY